jgi:hypothetical protein
LFLSVFVNQTWHIGLRKSQFPGFLFAIGKETMPASTFQLMLHGLPHDFSAGPVFFFGGSSYLRQQSGRQGDRDILACCFHVHSVSIAKSAVNCELPVD